ncbi:MAG: hypothetical protein V3W32_05880, partial [Gemmatimonadota bacterium]
YIDDRLGASDVGVDERERLEAMRSDRAGYIRKPTPRTPSTRTFNLPGGMAEHRQHDAKLQEWIAIPGTKHKRSTRSGDLTDEQKRKARSMKQGRTWLEDRLQAGKKLRSLRLRDAAAVKQGLDSFPGEDPAAYDDWRERIRDFGRSGAARPAGAPLGPDDQEALDEELQRVRDRWR